MRLSSIAFVSLIAVFGGAQLAGCASSPGSRATGQVLDDGALTARVKTAIARDASLGTAKDVNVTTYRGVVQLSGFVAIGEERPARESFVILQAGARCHGLAGEKGKLPAAPRPTSMPRVRLNAA